MATLASRAARRFAPRVLIWLFHLALPLVGLWLLLANPQFDVVWEDHDAHFWLILATALVNLGLAVLIGRAAGGRGDARLFLVALAFTSASGFFALHAVATPAVVLMTPNASFVLSTPIGIAVAGAFGLASAYEPSTAQADAILARRRPLVALLALALAAWGVATLVPGSPIGQPLPAEAAQPILRLIAVVGATLLLAAAAGYVGVFRRRPSVVLVAIVTAFILLAEALVATAESRSWHASWWEWHVLLLLAFGYVAYSAHIQYRREGGTTALFGALSLEETVRKMRDEYAAALERLVGMIEAAAREGRAVDIGLLSARLSAEFGLTEGQAAVLARAAESLAAERREVRRLGLFRHYLSPEVADALLADPSQAELGGATVDVSILFADLGGFTSFAERSAPTAVVGLLNAYFGAAVPAVLEQGGTVVQFVGDGLVAMFNAPVRQPDHPLRAARAALEIQHRAAALAEGHPEWPRFRVAVASGPALVGNVGGEEVRSFTAIGDTVNLAARLQAEAAIGSVLVGPSTAERLGDAATLRPVGELQLRGRSHPVAAFELVALHEPPPQATTPARS
jgi:class 3 adenylate cyclase